MYKKQEQMAAAIVSVFILFFSEFGIPEKKKEILQNKYHSYEAGGPIIDSSFYVRTLAASSGVSGTSGNSGFSGTSGL